MQFVHFKQASKLAVLLIPSSSSFLVTILYPNNFLWLTGSCERVMQRDYCGLTPHQSPKAVLAQKNSFHFKNQLFTHPSPLQLYLILERKIIKRVFKGVCLACKWINKNEIKLFVVSHAAFNIIIIASLSSTGGARPLAKGTKYMYLSAPHQTNKHT